MLQSPQKIVGNVTLVLLSGLGCQPDDQGTLSAMHSAPSMGHTLLNSVKQLLDQM